MNIENTPHFGLDEPFPVQAMIMGFDFGTQRIGVAIGQAITRTASPLKPLMARDGIPNWDEIEQLLLHWSPTALVVGIPVHDDSLDAPITKAAIRFGRRLKARFRLPVFGADESFTSFTARQALKENGGSRLKKKHSVDSMAAKFILESWLTIYSGAP